MTDAPLNKAEPPPTNKAEPPTTKAALDPKASDVPPSKSRRGAHK